MRVVSLFIFISFYANALKAQISSSSTVSVLDSIAKNIPEIACKNVQDLGKYINTNFSSEGAVKYSSTPLNKVLNLMEKVFC